MRLPTNPRPRNILLLSVLFLGLFIATIPAQDLPNLSSAAAAQSSALDSSTATKTTASSQDTTSGTATSAPSSSAASSSAAASSNAVATDSGLPSGLPTLPGGYNYPAPTVPPTANAPFMQKTNLPEGTVFIIVGAVLGALGLAVLAWRGLVAWSLHRSVRRAALQQHISDSKSQFRPPRGGFYSNVGGSTLSLDHLTSPGGRNGGKSSKAHTPTSSLFFSPTAGTGAHTPGTRGSSYLPAGYYATGNAAPGNGSGMTHIGGGGSIGLSTLGPNSHGYSRTRSIGPSPPRSPSLPPTRGGDTAYRGASNAGLTTHKSSSTLNLPPQGRAPSAYLEDLFENHPPEQAPLNESRGRY
ncbi:MAG: hypothetical protein M1827_003047 [Pycnora praestabilis]|nr:MAG: hypothetical protein M1827_003047 [Pycnora praestabilis]